MTGEEFLYKYIGEARDLWLSTLPNEDEVEFEPSQRFQRKMKKLFRKYQRSARVNTAIQYAKRAAIVVLAAALVTFGGFMTVEANRTKFVQVVTEVFEILTSYFYTSEEPADAPLADVEFGWLPEGMMEVRRSESENKRYILFEDGTGIFVSYIQQQIINGTGSEQIIDTEGAEITYTVINGTEVEVAEKNGEVSISLTIGGNAVYLSTNSTVDLLVAIGEKIILK